MVGEVADLSLWEERTHWTLCMGFVAQLMVLSVRSNAQGSCADQVVKRLVSDHRTGGGYLSYAGGQITVECGDTLHYSCLFSNIQFGTRV